MCASPRGVRCRTSTTADRHAPIEEVPCNAHEFFIAATCSGRLHRRRARCTPTQERRRAASRTRTRSRPASERTPARTTSGQRRRRASPAPRTGARTRARSRIRTTSCRSAASTSTIDSFVVKDEYRPMIEAHAKYLQANAARADRDPGQHRRARQPRVQHRARPEARRRGEEDDAAAGRDRRSRSRR